MAKAKRKKTKSWINKVAEALLEAKTFDLSDANDDGYKTVAELITKHLLRDYSQRDRYLKFTETLEHVKHAFDDAVTRLECDNEKAVRKWSPPGKRNLEYVTLLPSYRNAKERDVRRRLDRTKTFLGATVKHIKLAAPTEMKRLERVATRQITGT